MGTHLTVQFLPTSGLTSLRRVKISSLNYIFCFSDMLYPWIDLFLFSSYFIPKKMMPPYEFKNPHKTRFIFYYLDGTYPDLFLKGYL